MLYEVITVAITLSLILIAGVLQVYLSSKESFRVQNELARLQENQRIAVEFLQNSIRQAGFKPRITSYNVCYTKLLRHDHDGGERQQKSSDGHGRMVFPVTLLHLWYRVSINSSRRGPGKKALRGLRFRR